jgi:hypothetical protein
MNVPVMTEELAVQLEKAECKALLSRLTAIQSRNGNPMGVEIVSFGHATLFAVKGIPGPSFNKVVGITPGEEPYIEEIIAFYRERSLSFQLDIIPGQHSPAFMKTLARHGLYQAGFHTVLYGVPRDSTACVCPQLEVREMGEDEFALFGEIYTLGFGLPSSFGKGIEENNRVLLGREGWSFYLATVEGEPAAIGVYYAEDGIATLAAAATVPKYRKRGCHSALTDTRINRALQDQCRLIVGQAKFGSISQINMQKKGMQIAYTKALWVPV